MFLLWRFDCCIIFEWRILLVCSQLWLRSAVGSEHSVTGWSERLQHDLQVCDIILVTLQYCMYTGRKTMRQSLDNCVHVWSMATQSACTVYAYTDRSRGDSGRRTSTRHTLGSGWTFMECHEVPPASVVGCAPHCHPTRSRILFSTSRNILILFHRRTARQVSSRHDATDRWSFRSNERIYFGALVQLIQSRFVPSLHSTDVQTIRGDEVMGRRRRASVAAKLCMMWDEVCLGA